jgi:glycosyltransferase involved in cell wall biosynthesis
VDLEFFAPPALAQVKADLVFVGSMDWMPNIDAMRYFASDILPLIRKGRPNCRIAIAGRKPGSAIQDLGRRDPNIIVTGTVPDVRPYLWGSTVCVVPLRVGGGTRLKIFEAMAAKLPVVSTSIGAEGLPVEDGAHILIADSAELFAQRCLELLNDAEKREELAGRAWQLVSSRFSWEAIAREFETILVNGPRPG